MSRDIAAGRLMRILPDWLLDAQGGVFLVRPSARFSPATTIAFKEWIESKFIDGPPWEMRF
jgi:DNA-binding transcriptional LysR family regulator